jgi:hypothetical protein
VSLPPARVEEDDVAGFDLDVLNPFQRFEIRFVDGRARLQPSLRLRLARKERRIEQHGARDDAVLLRIDVSPRLSTVRSR